MTQEDWQEVLYNGMSKTSAWAALYFIFLMTFGNYVLFNLLVAILVEGFATEVCVQRPALSTMSSPDLVAYVIVVVLVVVVVVIIYVNSVEMIFLKR